MLAADPGIGYELPNCLEWKDRRYEIKMMMMMSYLLPFLIIVAR